MNSAVVQNSNNTVVNIIMADPTHDLAPEGCILVALPDDSPVTLGWVYNSSTKQFTDPNPPAPPAPPAPTPQPTLAELQAQLAALTAQINSLAGAK